MSTTTTVFYVLLLCCLSTLSAIDVDFVVLGADALCAVAQSTITVFDVWTWCLC